MPIFETLLYLFVISITASPIYHLFGFKVSFLIMIGMAICAKKKRIDKSLFAMSIFLLLFIFLKSSNLFGGNYAPYADYFSATTYVQTIILLVISVLLLPFIDECSDKTLKRATDLFFIIYHSGIVFTIGLMMIYGNNIYRSKSTVGGLLIAPQYFLFIAIFMGMLFTYLIIKNKRRRPINFVLLGVNALYVVMSSYTTQILFFVCGVSLILFLCLIKKNLYRILAIVSLVVVIIMLNEYLPVLLKTINDTFFSNNDSVYSRINELVMWLSLRESTGTDFAKRNELVMLSVRTFFQYPAVGVPYSSYNSSAGLTIGSHAQWSDDIARLGLVGMVVWLKYISVIGEKVLFRFSSEKNPLKTAIVLTFLFYGFFNPFLTESFVIIAFLTTRFEKSLLQR